MTPNIIEGKNNDRTHFEHHLVLEDYIHLLVHFPEEEDKTHESKSRRGIEVERNVNFMNSDKKIVKHFLATLAARTVERLRENVLHGTNITLGFTPRLYF